MAKLKIKDLKIDLPEGFEDDFTDAQFIEWFEYEVRRSSLHPVKISVNNPLHKIRLKDCKFKAEGATLDDKVLNQK